VKGGKVVLPEGGGKHAICVHDFSFKIRKGNWSKNSGSTSGHQGIFPFQREKNVVTAKIVKYLVGIRVLERDLEKF